MITVRHQQEAADRTWWHMTVSAHVVGQQYLEAETSAGRNVTWSHTALIEEIATAYATFFKYDAAGKTMASSLDTTVCTSFWP